MIPREIERSYAATERLFFERVARAERLVAAQRLRVRRLEVSGFDIAQPQALLRLMEAVTEQFRTAWRLCRMHQPRPPAQLGASSASATQRSLTSPVPEEPSTEPAANLATFPCPHCGLTLALNREDDRTLVYEFDHWRRQCRHPALQTPVLCQLLPSPADAVH